MALTLERELRKKYNWAPPLPKNSDERVCHFHQAKPEFVGSRGSGGEGITSCHILPFASAVFAKEVTRINR